MFKGILFVLLALSALIHVSEANASDTSYSNKVKTILLVSVLDNVAFTESDTESLERFLAKLLPDHKFVHVKTYVDRSLPVLSIEATELARLEIKHQLQRKILPQHEITHFVLMEHGNTFDEGVNSKTSLGIFGRFGATGMHIDFYRMLLPLIGKFSDNAFVMLESCSTACGDLKWSQDRMRTLMTELKIKNGSVFAADRSMISLGYESTYHLKKIAGYLKNPVVISSAIMMGVAVELSAYVTGLEPSFMRGALVSAAIEMIMAGGFYFTEYVDRLSKQYNLGYLMKFKNFQIEKSYELNPYKNKDELFLKLNPKKYEAIHLSCQALFQ